MEHEGRSQSPLRVQCAQKDPALGTNCLWESEQHCMLGDLQKAEQGSSLRRDYRKLWKTHRTATTWPLVSEMLMAGVYLLGPRYSWHFLLKKY